MDLFEYALAAPQPDSTFPADTRRAARDHIAPAADHLRSKVLIALTRFDGTADEIANILNIDKLAIRPRFTELKAAGLIVDTGLRRANGSGRTAKVWRRTAQSPERNEHGSRH